MSRSDSQYRLPTDRGIAVVRSMDDGTKEVLVCDGVSGGRPKNLYATHFRVRTLRIHPGVRMEHSGGMSSTRQIVEVSSERPEEADIRVPGHGTTLVSEAEALRG